MNLEFLSASAAGDPDTITAVLVFAGPALSPEAMALDRAHDGALSRGVARRFLGEPGETRTLLLGDASVLLVGAGETLTDLAIEDAAGHAYAAVAKSGARVLELSVESLTPEQAARTAFATRLAAYRFDRHRTTLKPADLPSIETVRVIHADPAAVEAALAPLGALADGVVYARDLVSEPGNILYPAIFAERVQALEVHGLEIEVLGEAEMEKLGMGALLAVGHGSARESKLAVLRWNGGADGEAPIAFVGKGVTFDAGGLSLKPSKDMGEMTSDMGGAAAVAGVMLTLARRKARANVVGVLALVENMPDGAAQRPGDIVTSMSGQTIEVGNTDAEGRLVLADALWFTQQRFKPRLIVDLATLTGVIEYALGDDYAGLHPNDDALADALLAASAAEGENLWRMPMPRRYDKWHDTPLADLRNYVGHHKAGSIVGALFLQRFIRDTPWAHIDMASVVLRRDTTTPTVPDGAWGWGVRLLNRFVAHTERH